jgi:formylglycine-generating enzyme required for sulfatase activity
MVKIPAGKIEMPTTRPGVKTEVVEIKSIWVSTTELTWDHYEPWYLAHDVTIEEERFKLWGKSRPSYIAYSDPYDFGREGHPAIFIHPYSAGMYCKWLSEKTGMKYRLPSEAEWEYACRAGRERDGASVAQLLSGAWAAENSDESTHFVAERSPNPWGLYDMLGNVAEWVIGYDGQPVLKGGSFMDKAADLNSRMRQPLDTKMQVRDPQLPKSRWYLSDADYAGFRIVRED